MRARLGGMLLPLGRHSITNGVAVILGESRDRVEGQMQALEDQFVGWDELFAWRNSEVARLATKAGITADFVPYRDWVALYPVSYAASRDAYLRLRGVDPKWVVDTFPPRPEPTVVDLTKPWSLAGVGKPAPGETLRLSPGPDGHDATITADLSGCFICACDEPGCDWAWSSSSFRNARSKSELHANDGSQP